MSAKDRADRFVASIVVVVATGAMNCDSTFGTGGTEWSRSGSSRVVDELRDGNRGGRAGTGGLSSLDCVLAILFKDATEGALLTYLGCSDEYLCGAAFAPLGGSAGNSVSPQAGALMRNESLDFVLIAVNLRLSLPPDPEPFPEFEESSELLLLVSCDCFRAGSGGGA